MPLYDFRCEKNHESEEVFKVQEKPDFIKCPKCGRRAKSVISGTRIGSCWPEGRVFEHVGDKPRVFKNYKELDAYAHKKGCSVESLSPAQLAVRQEERRHKISQGINPAKSTKKRNKLKVPEKIEKAFRECPTVTSALKALKEDRV